MRRGWLRNAGGGEATESLEGLRREISCAVGVLLRDGKQGKTVF